MLATAKLDTPAITDAEGAELAKLEEEARIEEIREMFDPVKPRMRPVVTTVAHCPYCDTELIEYPYNNYRTRSIVWQFGQARAQYECMECGYRN